MKIDLRDTKYGIASSSKFNKQLKQMKKQGKDLKKLVCVIEMLANDIKLPAKYRDHSLNNNRFFKGCRECHVEPDWLLVYKFVNKDLILFLVQTGSHSEMFI